MILLNTTRLIQIIKFIYLVSKKCKTPNLNLEDFDDDESESKDSDKRQ